MNFQENSWFIVLFVFAILISGCAQKPAESDAVIVGAVMPLTGAFSEYGQDELFAIENFVNNYNSQNEKKINLIVEDSQSDPKSAVSAYNKLALEKPKAIMTVGSTMSLAIKPLVNQDQIPTLTVAVNPEVAGGYMIQNLMTSEDYVKGVVKRINQRETEKIGLIYQNDDFGISVREAFKTAVDAEIIEDSFSADETDFRSIVTKIKSKNPDAVFIIGTGKSLGLLIKQIRQLMGNITLYSTPEVNVADVKESAGESYVNIIYSDLDVDYEQSQTLTQLREKYSDIHNNDPSIDVILAYNGMLMIEHCIDRPEDEFFSCLKNAQFIGITGPLSVTNNRIDYSNSMTINQI